MKFQKTILKDHQVEVKTEFDAKTIGEFEQNAAKNISKRNKIPGFRPGKAPLDVIRRMYGDALIREEAIELLVNHFYPKLLDEAEIKPAAAGKLQNIEDDDPLKLTFLVPLEPTVKLGQYESIRLTYEPEGVRDKEIEEVLEQLRYRYSTATDIKRAATNGDLVNVRINASLINPKKGEEAKVLQDTPLQLIIGRDMDREEPFPFEGFDQQLISSRPSEILEVIHTYSKNSAFEKLRGKEVQFEIYIESIKELKLPELGNEFAKTIGEHKNLESLKLDIRKELEFSKKTEYDQNYYSKLLEKIITDSTIKYPPQVLEDEKQRVLVNFEQEIAQQNLDLDTYLKINKIEKDTFIEDEIIPAAKKQLEESLVIEEIARKENIELQQEELEKAYSQTFLEMQATTDVKKLIRKHSRKKVTNAILLKAASRLLNKQVLNRLKEIADNGSNKKAKNEKNKKEKKEE